MENKKAMAYTVKIKYKKTQKLADYLTEKIKEKGLTIKGYTDKYNLSYNSVLDFCYYYPNKKEKYFTSKRFNKIFKPLGLYLNDQVRSVEEIKENI